MEGVEVELNLMTVGSARVLRQNVTDYDLKYNLHLLGYMGVSCAVIALGEVL